MATVSKKQLEESGFTNLRDYLNNERGLTRKGEPISFRSADPITRGSEARKSRGRSTELDMSDRDGLGKQMSESGTDMAMAQRDSDAAPKFLRSGESGNSRGSSKYLESGQEKVEKMKEADAEMLRESRRGMKKGGMTDLAQDKAMIKKAFKQHDAQQHKGKSTTLKLAKGGAASKRADGCCTKGKTKGKFV